MKALVVFSNGRKPHFVSQEVGRKIWQVLVCEIEPENEHQADFIQNVRRVYLDKTTAPASYLQMYFKEQKEPWYYK